MGTEIRGEQIKDGTVDAVDLASGGITAWVNFDGTASTPITPRASYNVSSVTKNATGDYTINFTTAMANANYAVSGVAMRNSAAGVVNTLMVVAYNDTTYGTAFKTTSIRVKTAFENGTVEDPLACCVVIFGGM